MNSLIYGGYPYEVLEKQTPYINSMFRKVFTVTENLAKIPTDHVVFLDWST
jgi:hypothetical protein